jgi:acetyl esterase
LQSGDLQEHNALKEEACMDGPHGKEKGRRLFMKKITALGAAGLPFAVALAFGARVPYDPKAKFAVKVSEVPFRRTAAGRQLVARIYQPQGSGPFPVLLDLHGGAWSRKDRLANEPMDQAVAAAGMLVVAVDLRLSAEAPYPASVQDANYGVRWLKWKAADWNGDASTLGVLGSSSGGHIALLLGMRPRDARYNAIALPEAPELDATAAYVATRAPISDPHARFLVAEKIKREELTKASRTYFQPWENIHEGNPQEILDRREKVGLPPLLIMQGGADDHMLPANQRKFAAAYRSAGGEVQFELFEGGEHEWTAQPGPLAERAHDTVKAFIARNLAGRLSLRPAGSESS